MNTKKPPVCPCKDCEDRYTVCHAYCKLYKRYREEHEKYMEPILKEQKAYAIRKSFQKDSYNNYMRSRRGKK